jgi:ABC-type microcin C transport system permease subunit YejE
VRWGAPDLGELMDFLSWSQVAWWIVIGAILVIVAMGVWGAITEAAEESSFGRITEADLELFRSWTKSGGGGI